MPDGKERVLRRKLCLTWNNRCQAERWPMTTVRMLDAWLALAWAVTKAHGACGVLGLVATCVVGLGVFSLLRIGVPCHSVVSWVMCTPVVGWVGDPWSTYFH